MHIMKLVVLFLAGCSGYDPPAGDGGVEPLSVIARTVEAGPHPKHSIVELAADASGGSPPYLFTWKDPAVTSDSFRGSGQIDSGEGVVATVSVVDSLGNAATDSIEIAVEGSTLLLRLMIEGSGSIDAGSLGVCSREQCAYQVEAGATIELRAMPLGDSDFLGWSGCSSSTDAAIEIEPTENALCIARFGQGTTCENAPLPIADIAVRPELGLPAFAKDASGYFVVPPNVPVLIDGLGSRFFAGEGLTFEWAVTWDPLHEVPESSVAFFEIRTPGFANVRADAVLTVTDDCGRASTATASYITE